MERTHDDPFQAQSSIHVQPQKASVAIYEQIRDKILSGELKPGSKLPAERDLIEMFQRSRPTVREAMQMLENKNYVTISRGKGTVVNKPSTAEIERTLSNLVRLNLVSTENVISIRNVCENLAISLAARNRSQQDIAHLQALLDEAEEIRDDFRQYMDSGIQFNVAIARASHNEMLYLIVRITSKFSHDKMSSQVETLGEKKKAELTALIGQQHQEMLDAIIAQDAERAETLNNQHIQSIAESLYKTE